MQCIIHEEILQVALTPGQLLFATLRDWDEQHGHPLLELFLPPPGWLQVPGAEDSTWQRASFDMFSSMFTPVVNQSFETKMWL